MSPAEDNPGPSARAARPTLAVSMGDPLGIGPEVIVKALADPAMRRAARHLIFGLGSSMARAADAAGVEPFWWRVRRGSKALDAAGAQDVVLIDADDQPEAEECDRAGPGRSTRAGGALSFQFVEDAIQAARTGEGGASAIVTAPISKAGWSLAGRGRWAGHTELLASRFGAKRTRMMFVAPELRVILATGHIALMDLRNVLTIGRVHETIDLGREACVRLGIERPRIAVAGLNPHAGEEGLFGDEEARVIGPAIELAQGQGLDVEGPLPGDTVFNAAVRGRYDLVVAMYHDQGLIPVKLLAFDRAVNCTVGLPVVRTSPDHGVAFDIAGRSAADDGSMRAALGLAARLTGGPTA